MHTTEIIITLARKLGISQVSARSLLRDRLNGFGEELIEQGIIELPGLGKIEVTDTKVRRQYIPGKDCICLVPAHKRLSFKINNLLKARLKRQGQ